MNSGVLQFSLGLATGGFLNPLNSTIGKLAGFIGGMVSLGAITEGVMSAIERGAALEHLSKRTDTSVGSLFKLEKGFEAVGIEADSVGSVLFKLRKSLGGVNEYGEDTRNVFYRMGLSIDALKKMNAPQQIQAIAAALAKLNISGASNAAGSIFGREGAAQMVQLSRSAGEFSDAMRKANQYSALWEKLAPAADHLERSMKFVRMEIDVIGTEVATQLLPMLQGCVDAISKINFTKIASGLGETILTIKEVFVEGKLGEFLSQGLLAGLEKFANVVGGILGNPSYWKGLFDVMVGEFQVAIGTMISAAEVYGATITAVFDKAAHPGTDWGVLYQQSFAAIDKGLGKFSGGNLILSGVQSMTKGVKEQAGALADAWKNSGGPEQDKFGSMVAGLHGRAMKRAGQPGEAPGEAPAGSNFATAQNHYKNESNIFEKMGFVTGGSANPMIDLSRRTASATEKTVNLLTSIRSLLGGAGGAGAVNQL